MGVLCLSLEKNMDVFMEDLPSKNFNSNITTFPKNKQLAELLRNAIVADEFLRDLDASQINDIVSVMFPMDYDKGAQFVKENELGNFVYVMESGKALASRNDKVLFKIFSGKLFGEPQAMLFNSPRTTSIVALENSRLWAIDRVCLPESSLNISIIIIHN